VLYTPDAALPLYAGSVRERMIECALDGGLGVEEGRYGPEELAGADAVLLTNAARGVEAARSCDGEDLPEPPPVVAALAEAVEARRIAGGLPLGREGPGGSEGPDAAA
jgi:branched-subunit amino acid aminotransferase/4-amino-4-deoxychorismate lyase